MSRMKERVAMSKVYSTENGKRKGTMAEELAFLAGALWADKTMLEKVTAYAEEKYDLDFCENVKDILGFFEDTIKD